MAGYTSTERKYGEYIQPFNIDLIAKSLSYKEGKYEEADAKIRQSINEIGSLDILKEQDKSYLLSRLTSMVGNVNNVGTLDLADSGVVKNLDNYISQSIDDKVMNAYHSTKQVRAFNSSMRDIQKNQKEIYNVRNEDFAMNPVRAYMASDKVGDELSNYGSLVYTPYMDIEGETNKQMMDIVKNMKDGKVKFTSPDGKSVYERDVRGMTDPEIRELVGSVVSSKYSEQASIDSWARYDRYSPQGLQKYKKDVDNFVTFKTAEIDERNVYLNQVLNSVKDTDKDVSGIKNQILRNNLSKEELNASREAYKNNPTGFGGQLEREIVVSNLTSRYQPMLKKLDDSFVGKNEVYYADMENQFKEFDRQINIEKLEIDRAKLQLDIDKNNRDEQEFKLKASGQWKGDGKSSSTTNADGTPKKEVWDGIGIGAVETAPAKDRAWEKETIGLISEKNTKVQEMTKQTYDYVTRLAKEGDERAKSVIAEYDLKRKGKHNGGLFREIYNLKAPGLGLHLVKDKNGNQIFTMSDLSSEVEEFNGMSQNYKVARDKAFGNITNKALNDPYFIENITKNSINKNLEVATPNGLLNLRTLMIQDGVIDKNGNKLKDVTSSARLKNTILSNVVVGKMMGDNAVANIGRGRMFKVSTQDVATLDGIFNSNLSSIVKNGALSLEDIKKASPNLYNTMINFEKGLPQGQSKYNSGNGIYPNLRLNQDGLFKGLDIENVITTNKTVKESFNQDLMANLQGVGVDNAIVMSNPDDLNFKKVAQQIAAFGRPGDGTDQQLLSGITPDKIKEIKYRVQKENGEMRVSFKIDLGAKLGISTHEAFLSVADLERNAPGLMSGLDFQKEEFYYSRKGMGNKKVATASNGIGFVNPTSNFIHSAELQTSLQSEFGGLPFYEAIVSGLHKDDTRRFLYNQFTYSNNKVLYNDVMKDPTIKTPEERALRIKEKELTYLDAVEKMINNSSNYVMDASFINDNHYALQLKDKSGRAIAGIVQEGTNLKPVKKLFDNYESSAYTMFLTSMIMQEKNNLIQGAYEFSTPFKNLTGLQ